MIRAVLWLAFALIARNVFAQHESAKEIMIKADEHVRGQTAEAELIIRTTRPTWSREMTVHTWMKGDYQLIAGWFDENITFGTGWSGSLGDVGWKGEVQYFGDRSISSSQFNFSTEANYLFSKGCFVSIGFLYNEAGLDQSIKNLSAATFQLSPRNLMPTRWNTLASVSKEITPLFSMSYAMIYAPASQLIILLPSFTYNLATNWDINFVWQSFLGENNGRLESFSHRSFLRLKWSF